MKFGLLLLASALTLSTGFANVAEAASKKAAKAAPVEETQTAEESLNTKLVVDTPAVAANDATPNTEATQALPGETAAAAPVVAPKVDVSKTPENEIPVLTNAAATKKAESGGMARVMITLGVMAALLGAVTFGLKRWSAKKGTTQKNTRIKILTQHALGAKKSLAIVQVAGESILIGITDQNISMLRTLSLLDDEIPEAVPKNFENAMATHDADDEDFAMHGLGEIRDVVTRGNRNNRSY